MTLLRKTLRSEVVSEPFLPPFEKGGKGGIYNRIPLNPPFSKGECDKPASETVLKAGIHIVLILITLLSLPLYARPQIKPLISNDALAQASRVELARDLYSRGLQRERAGDISGAIRIWSNVYNLDNGDKMIVLRLQNAVETLFRLGNSNYHEALFDIEYGRKSRAYKKLLFTHGMLDGLFPELEKKIIKAADEIRIN